MYDNLKQKKNYRHAYKQLILEKPTVIIHT